MSLSQDEIIQIMKMVEESDFGELRLETGDLKLVLRKKGYAGPGGAAGAPARDHQAPEPQAGKVVETSAQPAPKKAAGATVPEGSVPLKSPMLGTVYRRPSPDAPPYVEVGSFVKEDDTVCLIEVMKVFTAVKAGIRGTVQQILVETNEMVEYGQPLFIIKPETTN